MLGVPESDRVGMVKNKEAYISGLFDLILGVSKDNSSGSDEVLLQLLRFRKGRSLVSAHWQSWTTTKL